MYRSDLRGVVARRIEEKREIGKTITYCNHRAPWELRNVSGPVAPRRTLFPRSPASARCNVLTLKDIRSRGARERTVPITVTVHDFTGSHELLQQSGK